jgi:hypothetical protein
MQRPVVPLKEVEHDPRAVDALDYSPMISGIAKFGVNVCPPDTNRNTNKMTLGISSQK